MAGLGIKLTPEETADAFKGIKLTPEELGGGPRPHKYPQPKSTGTNYTDEEAGLTTPPIDIDEPMFKRLVGILRGAPSGYGPEMERMKRGEQNEAAREVVNAAPMALAGGIAGKAVGAGLTALAARGASKAAPALAGTLAEMRAAAPAGREAATSLADKIMSGIEKTAQHSVSGAVLNAVGHHFEPAVKQALGAAVGIPVVAAKAAVTALPTVVAAGGAAASQSPMFNMIDRLRTSSSPRASELYAKIQALKSPDLAGAGTGEVTQGPAGAQP